MKWIISNSIVWLMTLMLPCAAVMAAHGESDTGDPIDSKPRAGKSYAPYPQPDNGYVTDKAGLLTEKEKEKLNAYCYTTEKHTDVEVVVVTIGSIKDYPGTDNRSIKSFACGLFDKYGIGNMPKNDGVLLLVARDDRKVRIELGNHYGRGRDGDARSIVDDDILPCFRDDDYAAGIIEGTRAIIREFAGVRIGFPWTTLWLGLVALALILVCVSLFRSGKRGWGWVVAGIVIILVVFAFKTFGHVVELLPRNSGPGGFGGSSGGSSFGGGFSGGGGATGSW